MNFIDVTPEALTHLVYALSINPNVRVIGTEQRHQVCRFSLDVSAIYDGPPCQWTATVSYVNGASTTNFEPIA